MFGIALRWPYGQKTRSLDCQIEDPVPTSPHHAIAMTWHSMGSVSHRVQDENHIVPIDQLSRVVYGACSRTRKVGGCIDGM